MRRIFNSFKQRSPEGHPFLGCTDHIPGPRSLTWKKVTDPFPEPQRSLETSWASTISSKPIWHPLPPALYPEMNYGRTVLHAELDSSYPLSPSTKKSHKNYTPYLFRSRSCAMWHLTAINYCDDFTLLCILRVSWLYPRLNSWLYPSSSLRRHKEKSVQIHTKSTRFKL